MTPARETKNETNFCERCLQPMPAVGCCRCVGDDALTMRRLRSALYRVAVPDLPNDAPSESEIEAAAKEQYRLEYFGNPPEPWETLGDEVQNGIRAEVAPLLVAARAVATNDALAALRALVGESWHRGAAIGLTQANVDAARSVLASYPVPLSEQ